MTYQVHAALVTVLDVCAIFGVSFLVVGLIVAVTSFASRIWRYWCRRSRLDYERYQAEQAIRGIKWSAAREMLEAERTYRHAYQDPDIIESTAMVEVDRG